MKSLTKKAIVLASAIAVAGTFAVCAATYTSVTPALTEAGGKTVSVPFVTDVQGTDQITILAYCTSKTVDGVTTTYETPDANNIVFIDQVQKDTTTGTITFSLRETDPTTATYKVLMGGTGVTTAGFGEFSVAPAGPTGYTVSGAVTPVFSAEEDMVKDSINYSMVLKTSENISSEDALKAAPVLYTATVNDTTGAYSFENVANGNYILVVSRPGYLYRCISVTVNNEAFVVPNKDILLGDCSEDGNFIDTTDVDMLLLVGARNIWDDTDAQVAYPIVYDFNADGFVDTTDKDNLYLVRETWQGSSDMWTAYEDDPRVGY